MLVQYLLSVARERLVTISDKAPLIEAARLLRRGTDIVVACDAAGHLTGVVTKTDVVGQISTCLGASCTMRVELVMTQEVTACEVRDDLQWVWTQMTKRGLKNLPVIDSERVPLGVLTARDVLKELLKEAENEEELLRDYVMGIGYR